MPNIYVPVPLYLENYLIGNFLTDVEEIHIKIAFDILEKHLKDTPYKPYSLHDEDNRRSLAIIDRDEDEDWFEFEDTDDMYDEEYWISLSRSPDIGKKIAQAMKDAEKEFNEKTMSDMSRVLNTKTKDLPLLIGRLKDSGAIKLMERLMKNGNF